MTNFAKKVTTPDPDTINTLCHAARVSTMTSILGSPQLPLNDDDCQDKKASQKVKDLLETRNVGPFSAKGIKPFLDLLTRVFARVKSGNPDLYSAIKQDGVLCVRYIKDTSIVSNHSWGTAIDFTMLNTDTGKHELDWPRGNGTVQLGCLELYKYFKEEGMTTGEWCFWGAGFSREDGMHFEASDQLIKMWRNQGKI
jgi:hypothetical protein